ncbi:MAG: hypothetical protein RMY34_35295 [Aulosira sp. DedQUE10]|nr:hypothetical protein [Aulosira sp. DedQUE10]
MDQNYEFTAVFYSRQAKHPATTLQGFTALKTKDTPIATLEQSRSEIAAAIAIFIAILANCSDESARGEAIQVFQRAIAWLGYLSVTSDDKILPCGC